MQGGQNDRPVIFYQYLYLLYHVLFLEAVKSSHWEYSAGGNEAKRSD